MQFPQQKRRQPDDGTNLPHEALKRMRLEEPMTPTAIATATATNFGTAHLPMSFPDAIELPPESQNGHLVEEYDTYPNGSENEDEEEQPRWRRPRSDGFQYRLVLPERLNLKGDLPLQSLGFRIEDVSEHHNPYALVPYVPAHAVLFPGAADKTNLPRYTKSSTDMDADGVETLDALGGVENSATSMGEEEAFEEGDAMEE